MARNRRGRRFDRDYFGDWFPPYVSASEKRERAQKSIKAAFKKGETLVPISVSGRNISTTFWGKAWCQNLESYSDYSNRLPRGRSYVRNGSVIDLKIIPGKVVARVSGSSVYKVEIGIKALDKKTWQTVVKKCAGQIDSVIELLQGRLSEGVMRIVTSGKEGLFPTPQQITMSCSCPDWATMCKHVAATLYGVGNRLDHEPELLFTLRQINHLELIEKSTISKIVNRDDKLSITSKSERLEVHDIGNMFGIEMDEKVTEHVAPLIPNPSAKIVRESPKKTPRSAINKAKAGSIRKKSSVKKTTAKKTSKKKIVAKSKRKKTMTLGTSAKIGKKKVSAKGKVRKI